MPIFNKIIQFESLQIKKQAVSADNRIGKRENRMNRTKIESIKLIKNKQKY
jgi:hypothetical protein